MSDLHILPAQASPTGNYRGVCDWADRPLTFNSVGDTLRIADRAMVEYVWSGTAWVSDFAAPGAIGGTTPAAGSFTTLSASGLITSTVASGTAPLSVLSTTQVANLNVAMLGGKTFAAPGAIGGTTPGSGKFSNLYTTAAAPASATATGTFGEIRADADYIYVCTATDTWKRVAIATWA